METLVVGVAQIVGVVPQEISVRVRSQKVGVFLSSGNRRAGHHQFPLARAGGRFNHIIAVLIVRAAESFQPRKIAVAFDLHQQHINVAGAVVGVSHNNKTVLHLDNAFAELIPCRSQIERFFPVGGPGDRGAHDVDVIARVAVVRGPYGNVALPDIPAGKGGKTYSPLSFLNRCVLTVGPVPRLGGGVRSGGNQRKEEKKEERKAADRPSARSGSGRPIKEGKRKCVERKEYPVHGSLLELSKGSVRLPACRRRREGRTCSADMVRVFSAVGSCCRSRPIGTDAIPACRCAHRSTQPGGCRSARPCAPTTRSFTSRNSRRLSSPVRSPAPFFPGLRSGS